MWRESEFSFRNWSDIGRQVIAFRESRQTTVSRQYFIAAGTFAAATVLRMTVLPIESGLAFLTFYPGTVLVALFCGAWPNLLYILLAAAAGAYVFIPPYWTFSHEAIVPAIAFSVAALTISMVIHFYQRVVALQLLTQAYIASHDDLTKLPNRKIFKDRLRHTIALSQREDHMLAVLLVDLDNFKIINDTLGHDVGDMLLEDIAKRLLNCVRGADSVARLGGDEFAVLLYNIDSLEASTVCRRIIDALGQSIQIRENSLCVTASIGISLFPNDGSDESTLLKNADVAMHHAKAQGKNRFQYFDAEINRAVLRRHALEARLRLARQRNAFDLHYQPKISIANGTMVGAEALIRWTDPDLGAVSPAEFIPVAERAGLIGSIGHFVVSRVINDILEWHSAGLNPPPIAVNISPSQLRDDGFATWLQDSLNKAGLHSSSIVIELTEGALMDQGESGLKVLNVLASCGVKISIDDFGTGYSSLSYLKRLPIAELKIDRSFVDGIATETDDKAIAIAILSLAHTLGLSTVAEGVETAQQLAVLRMLGCDTAQGYFFHKPMEREHFRLLLQSVSAADSFVGASAA